MDFSLPKLGKKGLSFPHFPSRHQAFIFRAYEYIPPARIASLLGTTEEKVRTAAAEMGLPDYQPGDLWLRKGYITIIRRMWHILPYEQLLELLEMDEQTFALILREEDFLDIKLGDKPLCEPVCWRELTAEEQQKTAAIKAVMKTVALGGVKPFSFSYEVPSVSFEGEPVFDSRLIYAFSGLYQNAFEVDSERYCPDEMLEAYRKLGVNGVWCQAVLYQLTSFPFDPSVSVGYQKRQERMRAFADRLARFGMKLFLYVNEPRSMPAAFFDKHPELKGHIPAGDGDKICLCTSQPAVQNYLKDNIEALCRAVPNLGGFFTITRSENWTNCYSRADDSGAKACNCPRCSKRSVAEVVSEVTGCIAKGAHRVDPAIKVIAWSWGWKEHNEEIIRRLPRDVILMSQSELAIPFEIGGVNGEVKDYSMSIIGPGERAEQEWKWARECGLETGAKVQINTTWECSTVPAMPVFPSVEEHISRLQKQGVKHLLLSWTLGGYPCANIAHAAKYFYEKASMPAESKALQEAAVTFSEAFKEFPFHVQSLYYGPQNAGPSTLLFEEATGYEASMTCFAYDDLEKWRAIYPVEVYEEQYAKLCAAWEEGLVLLENEPENETVIMARAAYCLFRSSLNQIRFIRSREAGDRAAMRLGAESELQIAREMLALMNKNAAIGFEAANHYYFSKGQLAEKIINCFNIIERLS